jgi:hypothetical protein
VYCSLTNQPLPPITRKLHANVPICPLNPTAKQAFRLWLPLVAILHYVFF